MDEEVSKAVKAVMDKIPTDKLYDDLFSPPLKKVGEVLANIIDAGNLILLPIKLANARSKLYLENNLKKYKEKLDKIPEDDLQKVPEQIGLPIFDKLTSTGDENLSNAFINLLTKASSKNNVGTVHPSFVSIIDNLSVDEAILLFKYRKDNKIPFIDVLYEADVFSEPPPKKVEGRVKTTDELRNDIKYLSSKRSLSPVKLAYNLTGIELSEDIKLYFPKNIDLYLENLERLGIISFADEWQEVHKERYDYLTNELYKDVINRFEKELEINDPRVVGNIRIVHRCIGFTSFGQAFIDAAIKDIEEKSEEVE
ncbi:DUF4393 domain-containing protein [Bernardetia sp.]|uniref:DUF4393 domain-containing protein n=1 Tax=Bernardetia sp. TaxID=1937974 RepID=UPI0025C1715F|nr:DUF4393 domain-containing protein [Bernardetia sp.]